MKPDARSPQYLSMVSVIRAPLGPWRGTGVRRAPGSWRTGAMRLLGLEKSCVGPQGRSRLRGCLVRPARSVPRSRWQSGGSRQRKQGFFRQLLEFVSGVLVNY